MKIKDFKGITAPSVDVAVWTLDRDGNLKEVASGKFRELSEDILELEVAWIEAVDADCIDISV